MQENRLSLSRKSARWQGLAEIFRLKGSEDSVAAQMYAVGFRNNANFVIATRGLSRSWRFWECLQSPEMEHRRDCCDQTSPPVRSTQKRTKRDHARNRPPEEPESRQYCQIPRICENRGQLVHHLGVLRKWKLAQHLQEFWQISGELGVIVHFSSPPRVAFLARAGCHSP